jgi:hypothetical protein
MKKLATAIIATALIGFAHAPVSAQTEPEPIVPVPEESLLECGESDGRTDTNGDGVEDACTDYYFSTPSAAPPKPIVRTGSETALPLQLGAALTFSGLIAVVATHRRRSSATVA